MKQRSRIHDFNRADRVLVISFAIFVVALAVKLRFSGTLWAEGLLWIAEASLVGGVADWFAVTALFARPLGFPYHTAILLSQREAFAAASIEMMLREFFSPRRLLARMSGTAWQEKVKALIFTEELRDRLVKELTRLLSGYLGTMDLSSAGREIADAIRRQLWQVMPDKAIDYLAARLGNEETAAALFKEMASWGLMKLEEPLAEKRIANYIRSLTEQKSASMLTAMLAGFAEMVDIANYEEAAALIRKRLIALLQELSDPTSELGTTLRREFAGRLAAGRDDSKFADDFCRYRDQLIAKLPLEEIITAAMNGYRRELFSVAVAANDSMPLPTDKPSADFLAIIPTIAGNVVDDLLNTCANSPSLAALLEDMAARSLLWGRTLIADTAAAAFAGLTDEDLNRMVYDRVEPDLLWIRMNGSIVGALIGCLLFLLLEGTPRLLP